MTYKAIEVRREGGAAFLTLNRPERLNALNPQMVDELRDYFGGLTGDRETRVVVVRGAGRAFCAGLDLKEPGGGDGSPSSGMRGQRHISELALLMRRAPQPFIACIHGAGSGGGFALALASDVRLAGESARMNAAFIFARGRAIRMSEARTNENPPPAAAPFIKEIIGCGQRRIAR